jgi:MFS family permease
MLQAWWNTNMDARRSVSLLIAVAGLAVVTIGIAATPASLGLGLNYGSFVGPVLGAALGGYLRHRVSDDERAPLWALAYGASVAAILVAVFGTAVAIRPTVRGIPGLEDVWSGLIVSGFLVLFVGAFLWERDPRGRRITALALVAVWLLVGVVFASMSRDPWGQLNEVLLGEPIRRLALGLILLLLAGVGVIWLTWRARRRGDAYVAHRAALGLAVSLAPIGLGVIFSGFWGLPGVIVFLVVAMAVAGIGVVVMLVRGAQVSSRTP